LNKKGLCIDIVVSKEGARLRELVPVGVCVRMVERVEVAGLPNRPPEEPD
jgi:hypothetical protein